MRRTCMRGRGRLPLCLAATCLALSAGCSREPRAKSDAPAAPAAVGEALAGKEPFTIENAKELFTIENDSVRLVVCPETGRIVEFGRLGEENLLWFNASIKPEAARARKQWINWGGDKVWPAFQSAWRDIMGRGWPPDEVLDGAPWELVERGERRLVIESRTSPHLQVRVRREIELAPGGPRVTIRNTMTRVAENSHPVHIWCVSQVRPAEFHLLHVSPEGPKKDPVWHDFGAKKPLGPHMRAVGSALRYDRPPGSSKIGTFGTWVAAVYEDLAFVEHVPYDPAGSYPDKSSVQLFVSDDYAELETLSPNVPLAEGESLSNTVTWLLVERPRRAPLEEFVELITASVNSP